MARLVKNNYYTSTGERKVNNYMVSIPKKVVKEANINDAAKIKVYASNGRIIIEKENV